MRKQVTAPVHATGGKGINESLFEPALEETKNEYLKLLSYGQYSLKKDSFLKRISNIHFPLAVNGRRFRMNAENRKAQGVSSL